MFRSLKFFRWSIRANQSASSDYLPIYSTGSGRAGGQSARQTAIGPFYPLIFRSDPLSGHVVGPIAWTLLGLLVVIDLSWFPISSLKFANSNFYIMGALLVVFLSWISVLRLVLYRLRGDRARIAKGITAAANGGDVFVRVLAFTVFFTWAGGVYLCLATSAALPLQDARLAALDHAFGFD